MAGGASGYKQETIILNDYNEFGGTNISRRSRTNLKGKTTNRVSFEIKSQPIVHTFDDEALGRGPAEALKEIIGDQIRDIGGFAIKSTRDRRKSAQKAFKANAMGDADQKRYAGGRIGELEPNQTVRLFNDSGRLGGNLAVGKNRQAAGERDWVVNVPANRFTDETNHLAKRLFALVPALGNPISLIGNKKLDAAISESIGLIIAKAENASEAKRLALKQARRNAIRAVAQLIKTVTAF